MLTIRQAIQNVLQHFDVVRLDDTTNKIIKINDQFCLEYMFNITNDMLDGIKTLEDYIKKVEEYAASRS